MINKTLDERSDQLDKQLEDNPIDTSIAAIVKADKQRGRQVKILAISLVLDIVLTFGLAAVSFQAHDLAIQADHSRSAQIESCKTGNEFRKTEANLWEHVLELQPIVNNLTPEQQAQRDKTVTDFRTYLTTVFAARDCATILP